MDNNHACCQQEAQKGGWSIKGVLETHVHADFVSGHCELGARTGATIYFGPGASDRLKFPHYEVKDGEVSSHLIPKFAVCVIMHFSCWI